MIEYNDALDVILNNSQNLNSEKIPLSEALNRVTVADIISPQSLPAFRNSAMDGFAVRTKDLVSATHSSPIELKLISTRYAGDETIQLFNTEKSCVEIMTGAKVDDDFDAIVPIENVKNINEKSIQFIEPVEINAHIRGIGEDFTKQDTIIPKSTKIKPEHILALSAFNINKVRVTKKPAALIISTGKELQTKDNQQQNGIYDANGPFIQACLKDKHDISATIETIHDDEEKFIQLIETTQAQNNLDIIISTGAVSAGKKDFIPEILRQMGATILFHKVAIRPGKPVLFAKLKNGSYYFGLPGNPASAVVGMRFFVEPLLRQIQGLAEEKIQYAQLTHDITLNKTLQFFQKAFFLQNVNTISILQGQESFKISPFIKANSLAVLCGKKKYYYAGDTVPVYEL